MKKKLYNRMDKNNTLKIVAITVLCISIVSYVIYNFTNSEVKDSKATLSTEVKINKDLENTENKQITKGIFYLFYLPTCGYCHRAMSYIDSNLKNKYKNIEFKYVDVSLKHGRNTYLKMRKELNIISNGVPVAVIGKKHIVGFDKNVGIEYEKTIDIEILNKKAE